MTDREKEIVMAYAGICTLTGDELLTFQKYVEDIAGRPVSMDKIKIIVDEMKKKVEDIFTELCGKNDNYEPKWIPIKDMIPAPCRNILVCDSDGDIYVSYMRTDHTFGFDEFGNRIKNVVAWMNAPEPYKESEE